MSRERELLEKAVDELEILEYRARLGNGELIADIRAELEKPATIECGWIDIRTDVFLNGWKLDGLADAKYRLLRSELKVSDMEKLLKISDVSDMIGYGNTKIDEWVAQGKFPQPIRPHGTGHPRWLLSEVQ
ncbi:MAG: hypothetical protein ABFD12_00430, partial [Syntrophorhabdus sp.]